MHQDVNVCIDGKNGSGCEDIYVTICYFPLVSYALTWRLSIYAFLFSDIDECVDGSAPCTPGCANTEGSYDCLCHSGYELNADGVNCDGM